MLPGSKPKNGKSFNQTELRTSSELRVDLPDLTHKLDDSSRHAEAAGIGYFFRQDIDELLRRWGTRALFYWSH